MPTANSVGKPKASRPMGMGMGMAPVDPKKFRVEAVVSKQTTNRPSPLSNTSSPRPRPSGTSTPSSGANGRKAHKVAPSKLSPATNGHMKRKDVSDSARRSESKRASPAVRTPPTPMFDDDDDDSDDDDSDILDKNLAAKRRKIHEEENLDPDRRIYLEEAFQDGAIKTLDMVHAADIAYEGTPEKPDKTHTHFHNMFTTEIEDGIPLEHKAELQYPSLGLKERYNLVAPKENDDFKPIDEIIRVMTTVSNYYLEGPLAEKVSSETSGIILQLRRAIKKDQLSDFHTLLQTYNTYIHTLVQDGSIRKSLTNATSPLPLPWVEQILNQTYSRTVSLHVNTLRQYENGTDNVYGELLPRFVSNIFKETKLKSSQVFVDLGSGVGNVVLQAALEIGCESWGCEMMPNASLLATMQESEFLSRCKIWGLSPGKIHLESGDFLTSLPTLSALKRADVVLVNNQAFTPSLNDKLIMHFLDLKEGCQIVSLKSFVPQGHKIQARNVDSPVNLLVDRELRYFSDSVSWTDAPGSYHIARKDRRGLERFIREEMS